MMKRSLDQSDEGDKMKKKEKKKAVNARADELCKTEFEQWWGLIEKADPKAFTKKEIEDHTEKNGNLEFKVDSEKYRLVQ